MLKFRVSREEDEEIRAAANRNGLAISAFIVQVVLAAARDDSPATGIVLAEFREDLKNLTRQLNGIGVNLNQIARVANATGQLPGSLSSLADYCFRLVRKVDAAICEVGRRLP